MYLQISPVSGRWRVRLGLFGAIAFGSAVAFGSTALAQVVPDNTVGSAVSGVGGEQTITGGTRQGGNLFHSFDRFSVPTNGAAIFNNALDIQNILSRVTGGSVSDIDGLIRANGAANLFLLNPNGIIFGQNARLDVGGSFIATTASSINFADGTQFSATPGTGAPLLTVSVPLGLQFGAGAGDIVNRASGVGLQVGAGKTLGLIGGNVNLEGGRLTAAGGRIELGAVAAPGVVGINPDPSGFRFSFPTDLVLGDISLTNLAVVDTRAGGGGSITVNARNLSLFGGSALIAGIGQNLDIPDAVAGDIDINAQGAITIDGVGQFPSGEFSSGIFNNVNEGSTGKSGNINVKTGSLLLTNDGVISASIFGNGAGNVNITAADGVLLDRSVIFSRVRQEATGNGGSININARSLTLTNGAGLTTSSLGRGNAGNISITVDDNVVLDLDSQITSNLDIEEDSTGQFPQLPSDRKAGNITLKARSLDLNSGSFLSATTFSQGNAGNIDIDVSDAVTLDRQNGSGTGIFNNTENKQGGTSKGGNINIKTGSLLLKNGAVISASTLGQGDAGSITITAGDRVSLDNTSTIFSRVGEDATGNGGDISIKARSFSLDRKAQIDTSTSGQGDAGSVNITADEDISLDKNSSIFSQVEATGAGKGGDINLKARSLSLTNRATLTTSTSGQGDAGNIQITVVDPNGFMSVSDNSIIRTDSFSPRNAGNITITADGDITIKTGASIFSGLLQIQPDSTQQIPQVQSNRKGGDINIRARSLFLNQGALVDASTYGQGNAGNIDVNVRDAIIIDGLYIFTSNGRENVATSGISSIVGSTAVGNGGNITISAGSLSLSDSASLFASTLGEGNAGNLFVHTDSYISLSDSSVIRSVVEPGGKGNGGNIEIQTRSLSLTNGSQVLAGVFRKVGDFPGGQGKAGNIWIKATDSVNISGVSSFNFPVPVVNPFNPSETLITEGGSSGLFASTERGATGQGGNIRVDTQTFRIADGAVVSAITVNPSDGGSITINTNTFEAVSGGQVLTVSRDRGNAGDISLNATESVIISGSDPTFTNRVNRFGTDLTDNISSNSGLFAGTVENSTGQSGSLSITSKQLIVQDGAKVSASSLGSGASGNLNITAGDLRLDNGTIEATTTTGDRGNITVRSRSIGMRRGSKITTNASGDASGGNINIDTRFLIAAPDEDNDIIANAIRGTAGNIDITAQGIFGIQPRREATPETNDITANSELGIDGTVQLNSPEVDPSRDVVELPTGLVDASSLVAAGCPSGAENRFTVAGRGGLPPAPADKLSPDALLTDWATLQTPETQNRAAVETTTRVATDTTPTPPVETITEATSWQYDRNGAIILTSGDTTSSSHLKTTPTSCPSS